MESRNGLPLESTVIFWATRSAFRRPTDAPTVARMETRVVDRILEWRYQAEVVARLHKLEADGLPLTCAGDMGAGRRSRAERQQAKVTGLTAGEPDVRVYIGGGRLLCFELKTPRGSRSKDQKARHKRLADLGFEVITVAAKTAVEMADLVEIDVRNRLP